MHLGQVQMPGHGLGGSPRLAAADCHEDAAVHVDLVGNLVAHPHASLPGPGAGHPQGFTQTFEEKAEHAVSRGHGDRLVEVDVGVDVVLVLIPGAFEVTKRGLAPLDVGGGRPPGSERGVLHLDQLAQLEEVPEPAAVGAHRHHEEVAQRRGVDSAHHRPLARADFNQPAGGERAQGLADDARGDAVLGGELRLGGEQVARRQSAGDDALLEVAEHPVGEALPVPRGFGDVVPTEAGDTVDGGH